MSAPEAAQMSFDSGLTLGLAMFALATGHLWGAVLLVAVSIGCALVSRGYLREEAR